MCRKIPNSKCVCLLLKPKECIYKATIVPAVIVILGLCRRISHRIHNNAIDCSICMTEIPVSEANCEEASDYVLHFCGLDCYARWKELCENSKETAH